MLNKILSLFGFNNKTNNGRESNRQKVDVDKLVQQIRNNEEQNKIPQGKQIHNFELEGYSVSLDREFTGKYRISAFIGPHKVYGFNIAKKEASDEQLADILRRIITFLANNPSVKTLPQNDLFDSHFFGNP